MKLGSGVCSLSLIERQDSPTFLISGLEKDLKLWKFESNSSSSCNYDNLKEVFHLKDAHKSINSIC